jgi:coenzyme Q-binding protein COQ10
VLDKTRGIGIERLTMPSFSTTRYVPFTPRQMFDLVADVVRYPEFLPLCEGLTVKQREREGDKEVLFAEMTVGYHAIRETFVSRVVLDPAGLQVDAGSPPGYAGGPFRQLQNRWSFAEAGNGCDVRFFIAYEFRSLLLHALVGNLFDRVFRRYTIAFEERARAVYGSSSPTPQDR